MNSILRRGKTCRSLSSLRFISSLAQFWNWRNPFKPNPDERNSNHRIDTRECVKEAPFSNPVANSDVIGCCRQEAGEQSALSIQNLLNNLDEAVERALEECDLVLSEDLVLDVIKRHGSDWKPAYAFFNWAVKKSGYPLGSAVYNEILDVLGRMHRFRDIEQVLDEMSKKECLFDEGTYAVLLKRFSAAHKVDEAIGFLYRRREFGLEVDLASFRELLMWLCRRKHVEEAEALFYSKKFEFGVEDDITTMNIILNGWCVLGSVREAKRFWKDILASNCRPDRFTYATFIHALTKKGKLGSALKLFRAMWDKGPRPDVVTCNCIIDALCFKKRVPEALEVLWLMEEKGCAPNYSTYNSIIKHMCKIRRMEKVNEIMKQMESKGGSCRPTALTYTYLLKSLKKPEEVPEIMQIMQRNGCEMNGDLYNLVLKLYVGWDHDEGVKSTWCEMERHGVGPDNRSYTIMIHGLYDRGRYADALRYYEEMFSKDMLMEARTEILVNAIKDKLKEREGKGEVHDPWMRRHRKQKNNLRNVH
ncbi:hypothetical protein CDL15_Pgr002407 [Punica granatum]|uniref:Pentatricopeptide repeat-containing protein At3g15200 n=1 Tax=Punica granatum TaxID=22663 RepID=A0A218XUW3_PUNGR|nr:hypothetical protein CDL15_Pgr002407 [Punica granatum]